MFKSILTKLRQRFCSHSFALEDLTMVNRDSPGNDRVKWPCDKCGKVFWAQCGLDISPSNGPAFRRVPLDRLEPSVHLQTRRLIPHQLDTTKERSK